MRLWSLSIVLGVFAAGCAADPSIPFAAVTTLDETGVGDNFVAVSAGLEHTCALAADSTAYCWGSNEYGQLGAPSDDTCRRDDLNIPCRLRPGPVSGGLKFQKISAGGRITCGLATSGAIYCWGDNLLGGLGDPAYRASETPVAIASSALFGDVAAGGEFACGLRLDGAALCWGTNTFGQIGTGTQGSSAPNPVLVSAVLRFASIAAGPRRTCARRSDGVSFCWGITWVSTTNGVDNTRTQTTPLSVQTAEAPGFIAVSPGATTTCALTPASVAFCWEANSSGAMGDGTATGSQAPRAVTTNERFVSISTGAQHTCAVADTGRVWCWGVALRGQLGVSSNFFNTRCGASRLVCSTVPTPVSGYRTYTHVSAGQGDHSCGLTLGGNVFCWGDGRFGQRGNGATFSDWSPVRTQPPGL